MNPVSFADIKKQARHAVHTAFAVPVLYYPGGRRTALALDTPLTARLHNRVTALADPLGGGYAQIMDGLTHVVFDADELAAAAITPKQGDVLEFPDYAIVVRLDMPDNVTASGPVAVKWTVGKVKK